MTRPLGSFLRLAGAVLLVASVTSAQTPSPTQAGTPATAKPAPESAVTTRPASTTFLGDTGLWFVPTAEIVPNGRFAASAYRVSIDRTESFANLSDFTGTFAFGVRDRVEVFGSFRLQTRIDADSIPVGLNGAPMDHPLINAPWQTGVGDLYLGAKFNLMSQWREQPAAVAVRAIIKAPTGDADKGLSTGKPDFLVDALVSKEVQERVELAGDAGFTFRGSPDATAAHLGAGLSSGFRWGFGAAFPTRSRVRLIAELHGEAYFDSTVTRTPAQGQIGLPAPYTVQSPFDALVGVQYHHPSGFFAGAGLGWAAVLKPRSDFPNQSDETADSVQLQARLGYHPGARIYVPPPPPPPPPPANRPPTVKARCEPCTVEVGRSSTVTADAQDPDGDALAYRWSAPAGRFANPSDRQTIWTAPDQEGPVPVTVTVDDGKGGTASDSVTIQVVRPPKKEYTFEDVHFDFDRYSLRPDATRVLDEVVRAMQDDPELKIEIEGHTCNIGTAEYNLALGERRANSVRDYLVGRAISADRLKTVSYGEERPKYDNSREETRRLNRRAALVVRLTK